MTGLGFFAPFPLALMLPFMAGQSMIMGLAFGTSYQYGKRKISSMTNEQFNALDAEGLGKQLITDYNAIIPSLSQAVKSSSDFQSTVIKELIDVAKNLPGDFWSGLFGTSDGGPTSTLTQTDTSASNILYGGSIGLPAALLSGLTKEQQADIDELAKQYMEQTGLADFETAKKTIINNIEKAALAKKKIQDDINKSKAAASLVKPKEPLDTSVRKPGVGGFLSLQERQARKEANRIILLKNLVSAKASLKLRQLEYSRLRKAYGPLVMRPGMRASTLVARKVSLKKMANLVSGQIKVVNNILIQIKNNERLVA